ncbi:NUDIX domain-containing protein [Hankyongella ginsenosidimutans]|uniref:NUDIX domain-containing protein n=1 Tax=Hankyongella ginsenosidimutans TaxID=1763828 RepID=A0A4D7CBV7_9SPHN|nr:NUDIX domain-containing protein [Hankyongella ginsenosidimutans]QCI80276.1 NUDIX domain-containing protein [Hankyongella ginsenosidimutans]
MSPVPAAGVIVLSGRHVLLIRRGTPPNLGAWSLPGGRIQPGETVRAAALREVREETGLAVRLRGLVDVVDLIGHGPDGTLAYHYLVADFWAEAADAAGRRRRCGRGALVRRRSLDTYALTPEILRVIATAQRLRDGS